MFVYIGILIWIIAVNCHYSKVNLPQFDADGRLVDVCAPVSQIWWTMVVVVFFLGLRSAGGDTEAYIMSFENLPSGFGTLFSLSTYAGESEWLFKILGVLCRTLSSSYHLYLFVIAAISGFLVAYTLRRESRHYADAIALFMLMGVYGWMINGVRQFLAVSILFYASRLIVSKSLIRFLPFVVIAMFIHNSAILMLPVFFVVHGEAWNKRTLLFLAGGVLSVIFLHHFLGVVEYVTSGTVYDGYVAHFQDYGGGSNVIRTIIFAVPPVLAYMKRTEIRKIATPFINVAINMSIVCAIVSLIANFTSGILVGRIPIYFSVYNLVLLPWLLRSTSYQKNNLLPAIMYICYTIIFLLFTNSYYYSDVLFGGNVIPRLHF